MGDVLCETCLERGRERQADIVTENLQMCRDCFNGKPTCQAETVGGVDAERNRREMAYQRANAEHVRKVRAAWRARNRERVNAYSRKHYRAKTKGAASKKAMTEGPGQAGKEGER